MRKGSVRNTLSVVGVCGASSFVYFFTRERTYSVIPYSLINKESKPNIDRVLNLKKAENEIFDVIIIGGGATGCSIALDAASRGLRSILLEAGDFASETSSKSTKLLHGGVRYLESALVNMDASQLTLVKESLLERTHFLMSSPYTARSIPILLPLYSYFSIPYTWLGLKLYEKLSSFLTWVHIRSDQRVSRDFRHGNSYIPNCFWVSRRNCLDYVPMLSDHMNYEDDKTSVKITETTDTTDTAIKKLKEIPQLFTNRTPFNFFKNSTSNLVGGIMYYDGQHNDSRTCLLIALTACTPDYIPSWRDALILNHARVEGFMEAAEISDTGNMETGEHIASIRVMDQITKGEFIVNGRCVINATGVRVEEVSRLGIIGSPIKTDTDDGTCLPTEGIRGEGPLIVASKGTHVILPRSYTPHCGLLIPRTSDGRVLFAIPWENYTILGTTDSRTESLDNVNATSQEVKFLLGELSKYLSNTIPTRDVISAWSGLRALVIDKSSEIPGKGNMEIRKSLSMAHPSSTEPGSKPILDTKTIRRRHVVYKNESASNGYPIINVTGGKWTSSRLIAEETVDAAIQEFSLKPTSKCRTFGLPLRGNTVHPSLENIIDPSRRPTSSTNHVTPRNDTEELNEPRVTGRVQQLQNYLRHEFLLPSEIAEHLSRNYGTLAIELCRKGKREGTLSRLLPTHPHLLAEVAWAKEEEMGESISDILFRRLSVGIVDPVASVTHGVVQKILLLIDGEWNNSRRLQEVEDAENNLRKLIFQ